MREQTYFQIPPTTVYHYNWEHEKRRQQGNTGGGTEQEQDKLYADGTVGRKQIRLRRCGGRWPYESCITINRPSCINRLVNERRALRHAAPPVASLRLAILMNLRAVSHQLTQRRAAPPLDRLLED
ncbi:hypothetical protein J6590_046069 [Homalodisca vitripennis]|nr:hypothetical protein J6590_046069 [Homalodisca vitripennis]